MLNVVVASDDNYASLLLISVTSLLENNSDFECINVYVLDDNLSQYNKNRINNLKNTYSCNIFFIKIKQLDSLDINLFALEKDLTGTSLTTYARLFMPSLLPKDIDKLLYLDCDSLIVGSFKELWQMDISEYYCAAVLGTMNNNILKLYGFDEEDSYINAGFLLVNLKKWREDNVEEKFLEFLANNQGRFFYHDQGVINDVFKHKIKIIEPKYNLQYFFQYYDYDLARKYRGIDTDYYTKEIVDESRENPIFLHFCGHEYERPWNNQYHKYSRLFKEYAEKAGCDDVICYIESPSLKAKLFYKATDNNLLKFILKLIPKKLVKNIIDKGSTENYRKYSLKARESLNENDK